MFYRAQLIYFHRFRNRSEIHRNGKVLRSTEVLTWRTGEDIRVKVQPKEVLRLENHGKTVKTRRFRLKMKRFQA